MKAEENLCRYDPRNPDYDSENGERKENCYCDNCFYGRHQLANKILELKDWADSFMLENDPRIGGVFNPKWDELLSLEKIIETLK